MEFLQLASMSAAVAVISMIFVLFFISFGFIRNCDIRRISLANVKVYPPLGARAGVETGGIREVHNTNFDRAAPSGWMARLVSLFNSLGGDIHRLLLDYIVTGLGRWGSLLLAWLLGRCCRGGVMENIEEPDKEVGASGSKASSQNRK